MATGLVKWWRARFLAGYKPFSVVGGIAEGSDSEELLAAGIGTPCSSSPLPATTAPLLVTPETPPVTVHTPVPSPPAQSTHNDGQQTTVPNGTTRQLSFEEFECDVSVAEGNRRRQEFSFTLYDFDGHGKITKDDIAGLVTTIYDTLGASIQVPPCGSKTIKVKLTVSPDKSTVQAATSTTATKPSNLPNNITANTSCCSHVKPVSSCGHATHANRRLPRRRRVVRNRAEPRRPIESHSEDDADNVPPPPVSPTKQEEVRKRVGPVPHFPSPYSNSSEGDVSEDSETSPTITPLTPLVTNQRKRSGSMQRQQLLEIIQANMEKNNLSFHASRKRHQSDQLRSPLQRTYIEPMSPYSQRSRPPSANRQPTAYHKPVREYSHHTTSLPKLPAKHRSNLRKGRNQQNTTPQRNISTSPGSKPLRNNLQSPSIVTENLLKTEPNNQTNNNINKERNDAQFIESQQTSKASKKHQLKHATREQDQARAMAQVVRWLEREFTQTAAATTNAGRRHVHEHIHHHYHHYHAEALV